MAIFGDVKRKNTKGEADGGLFFADGPAKPPIPPQPPIQPEFHNSNMNNQITNIQPTNLTGPDFLRRLIVKGEVIQTDLHGTPVYIYAYLDKEPDERGIKIALPEWLASQDKYSKIDFYTLPDGSVVGYPLPAVHHDPRDWSDRQLWSHLRFEALVKHGHELAYKLYAIRAMGTKIGQWPVDSKWAGRRKLVPTIAEDCWKSEDEFRKTMSEQIGEDSVKKIGALLTRL
ncbi:hypothetical protein H1S01_03215 [Heliobacterium chlorum]|uniref:Uncharacterized protein n=1 Tax=Heliobacterium chlorum TaxID=2698 RepID=A0ABR7T1K5_HELCL|nr:hypothetical protein [Heliobacterium chlorum]MBC9783521.1 hypothetical protein [Heliobacterium chlorum]